MIRPQIIPPMYQTTIPRPSGAQRLPGISVITSRVAPGGVAPPKPSEAQTTERKVEYLLKYPNVIPQPGQTPDNPPTQAHTYATNPRKDGTTPVLVSPTVLFNMRAAAAAKLTAEQEEKTRRAGIVQNDTGTVYHVNPLQGDEYIASPQVMAATTEQGESGTLHWGALLIMGFVAWFVFKR